MNSRNSILSSNEVTFIINESHVKKTNILKMKKMAFEPIDKIKEKQKDSKYKTELCKTFEEKGICPYGNMCRFAHGKSDLLLDIKNIPNSSNYKSKDCFCYFKQGYCNYGSRCHYKHAEKNEISKIDRAYYTLLLESNNFMSFRNRLSIFEEICEKNEKLENTPIIPFHKRGVPNKGSTDSHSTNYSDISQNFQLNKSSFDSKNSLVYPISFSEKEVLKIEELIPNNLNLC